jgi:hypothetical protein
MSAQAYRDRKAYLRTWYLANRESEIKKAIERKKIRLANMGPVEALVQKLRDRIDWRVDKLRRDIRRTYDLEYRQRCKIKSREYEERYMTKLRSDPERLAKWNARRAAKVRAYRERKKTGDLRKTKTFEPINVRVINEPRPDKIKKNRLPRSPKGFKAAQKLAKIMTSNLTNETK